MFEFVADVSLYNGNRSVEIPINNLGTILFSQIFSGTPQLYAGSSFTIEEILEIGIINIEPQLISVDFRWYPPKFYYGTWTLFDQVSGFGTNPEERGYIEDDLLILKRYSTYTIQANPDVPFGYIGDHAIDDCNFRLKIAAATIPPLTVGDTYPSVASSIFRIRRSISKVPLIDQTFPAKIKTVGLYINEGAELASLRYKVAVINTIDTDFAPFPVSACSPGSSQECANDFNTFLGSSPDRLLTYAAAEMYITQYGITGDPSGGTITSQTWTCSTAPYAVYTYYLATIINIPN